MLSRRQTERKVSVKSCHAVKIFTLFVAFFKYLLHFYICFINCFVVLLISLPGDVVVPRPPFLLGLASKGAQKIWERRMQLHRLVETHMEKLREKLQDCGSETSSLQDAIMSLSHDVANARELEVWLMVEETVLLITHLFSST